MKNNKKGFTLAELLIVVAIIAVLVAIAIPVFTAQLEKAREATDMANLRSAYAEVVTADLVGDKEGMVGVNGTADDGFTKTVAATQKQANWQTKFAEGDAPTIGSVSSVSAVTEGNSWTVKSQSGVATIE